MRARQRSLLAISAVGLTVAVCSFDGPARSGGHTVRDSAGIRIVDSHAPAWQAARAWSVPNDPVVQIGRVSGPEAYELHRLAGALRLGDGTIVVANAGTGELRWFDRAGRHVASAGRTGGGPGEFRLLSWIGRVNGDSVYAWDRELRRLAVFIAGRFVRDARADLSDDRAFPAAHGVLPDGTILASPGPVYVPDEEAGVQRPPMPLWLLSPAGGRLSTLGPFPGRSVNLRPAATPGAWIRTEVPFGATTLFAPAGERIAVGNNAAYEIRLFAPTGELSAIIRRSDEVPRSVRADDLTAELERRLAPAPPVEEIREGIRASFEQTPAPETMPHYRTLMTDGEDCLWVRRYTLPRDEAPTWDVFHADGEWLGEVVTPAGLRVTDIGADYVLGIWEDDLDVEYVRMYELTKP